MTLDAWLFSAKRAWQNHAVKAVTIVTLAGVLGVGIWFCSKVIALRHMNGGLLVLHYNIELGIDAIRPWGWAFFLPIIWLLMTLADLVLAFGLYREDVYQAWTFFVLAMAWSIPWGMALWHLIRINQ